MNQQGEQFNEKLSMDSENAIFGISVITEHVSNLNVSEHLEDINFIETNFEGMRQLTGNLIESIGRLEDQIGFTKNDKINGLITSLNTGEKKNLKIISDAVKTQIIPFFESAVKKCVIKENSKKNWEKHIALLEGFVKKCELYVVGVDNLE